ncbi:transporter [Mycobacterium sp. NS-7484]|uniref:AmiS/UreI family transporter n=1 Tax=Mycobacterium sp. NS-7484 TaxID=1834161 RepID=UPI00096C3390|nr:AmiS/UreI family transporter [Mycobacterium sp. NS-7484]OMC00018.1 transporter [Mycobacterium sp. NS-7484]
MSNVGLFYVGAVLIVNGIMLLGRITPSSAAPLNLFVGAMQVVFPTIILVTADGDAATIAGASGLYLFGFTYLWVGVNGVTGWPAEGLGWFSLFVAVAAVGYAAHTWSTGGRVFVVIWLAWAALWLLFFVVLGLGRTEFTRFTGALAVTEGVLTAAVPAGVALAGLWSDSGSAAMVAAVVGCCVVAALWLIFRPAARPAATAQSRSVRAEA